MASNAWACKLAAVTNGIMIKGMEGQENNTRSLGDPLCGDQTKGR